MDSYLEFEKYIYLQDQRRDNSCCLRMVSIAMVKHYDRKKCGYKGFVSGYKSQVTVLRWGKSEQGAEAAD